MEDEALASGGKAFVLLFSLSLPFVFSVKGQDSMTALALILHFRTRQYCPDFVFW